MVMNEETLGATRSRVSVVVASALVLGPVLPAGSATPLAKRRGWRVPEVEQAATVTVKVVPLVADGVSAQPVAVPAFVKSVASIPETDSLKVRV
jgi:hypothetical protein